MARLFFLQIKKQQHYKRSDDRPNGDDGLLASVSSRLASVASIQQTTNIVTTQCHRHHIHIHSSHPVYFDNISHTMCATHKITKFHKKCSIFIHIHICRLASIASSRQLTLSQLIIFLTIENTSLNMHSYPSIKSDKGQHNNVCDVFHTFLFWLRSNFI